MDPTLLPLNLVETRVLGSLIEKAVTTPEYYPLSLGALTNACNQLSNRDPVVAFEETEVVRALDGLRAKNLAATFHGADNRVPKYKHSFTDLFLFTPSEVGLLCVLMLRGPQTLAELRTRTERFQPFESLAEIEEALQALASREPQPLIAKLPRQPGTKEPRYIQLLSAAVDPGTFDRGPPPESATQTVRAENERMDKLEAEAVALRHKLADLQQQFADFRKQFE